MNVNGFKIPEIITPSLNPSSTPCDKRKANDVLQRVRTAVGILNVPGTSVRTTLLPRRNSNTASSKRRASDQLVNFVESTILNVKLDSRRVSYHDVTARLYSGSKSPLRKSSSEPDAYQARYTRPVDRRGSLQVRTGGLSALRSISKFSAARRKSKVNTVPEDDNKVCNPSVIAIILCIGAYTNRIHLSRMMITGCVTRTQTRAPTHARARTDAHTCTRTHSHTGRK